MDMQFASKLQVALNDLGRKNGFGPTKSQDPANGVAHELYIATTGAAVFEKRKKAAIEAAGKLLDDATYNKIMDAAKKGVVGANSVADTEDYIVTMTTKSPSSRVDTTALRVALLKAGCDADVVNKAFDDATTKSKPPESWSASLKLT